MAKVLRHARRETTGSHAGFVGGGLKIIPMTGPLAGTGMTISTEKYYAPRFWSPDEYFTPHDADWGSPKRGRVDVGELQNVAPNVDETSPESEPAPDPRSTPPQLPRFATNPPTRNNTLQGQRET